MHLHLSIEVLPNHEDKLLDAFRGVSEKIQAHDIKAYVTHINGSNFDDALRTSATLKQAGFQVVPHLAARNITSSDNLSNIVSRFNEIGVDSVLFLGGDNANPQRFSSVQQLLDSGEVDGIEASMACFAAFPDGHLHAKSMDDAIDFIKQKTSWAQRLGKQSLLVTQIGFEPQSVLEYIDSLEKNNVHVPLCVGFVAPCKISKLMQMLSLVGVEKALAFAKKQNMFKLLTQYKSDEFLKPLLASKKIAGLHAYAFGNYSGAFENLADFKD